MHWFAVAAVAALGWLVASPAGAQENTCGAIAKVQASELSLAPELESPASYVLGGATGVLTQAYNQTLSVDHLITRLKLTNCRALAAASAPKINAGMIDAAGYKPKTEFDNTPWRFNMTQNGKKMTADEFDAWMKSKGIRIAKGAPQPQPAAVTPSVSPSQGATVPATP